MTFTEKEILPYQVGGLLYVPATHKTICDKLMQKSISNLTSLVFCLEDSIGDTEVSVAEANLHSILSSLRSVPDLPLIFIRPRSPEHLSYLGEYLGTLLELLTGFVLPKFDDTNLDAYFKATPHILRV